MNSSTLFCVGGLVNQELRIVRNFDSEASINIHDKALPGRGCSGCSPTSLLTNEYILTLASRSAHTFPISVCLADPFKTRSPQDRRVFHNFDGRLAKPRQTSSPKPAALDAGGYAIMSHLDRTTATSPGMCDKASKRVWSGVQRACSTCLSMLLWLNENRPGTCLHPGQFKASLYPRYWYCRKPTSNAPSNASGFWTQHWHDMCKVTEESRLDLTTVIFRLPCCPCRRCGHPARRSQLRAGPGFWPGTT